ncbi:hypothetical protein BDZ91DRAFT_108878 [Kalaharituber pfeilii]|nr:hypothetical protein BDZ91DRAFT_108878 [Kalaharituber pfeilii]
MYFFFPLHITSIIASQDARFALRGALAVWAAAVLSARYVCTVQNMCARKWKGDQSVGGVSTARARLRL